MEKELNVEDGKLTQLGIFHVIEKTEREVPRGYFIAITSESLPISQLARQQIGNEGLFIYCKELADKLEVGKSYSLLFAESKRKEVITAT
jgi:hypothetical protein